MKLIPFYSCCFLLFFFLSVAVIGQDGGSGAPAADSALITFRVDMSQWADKGLFNPATDSVDMPGTMNNWNGSDLLQKAGATTVYEIMLKLQVATVQEFRFRINRDTNNTELVSHMYRIPNDTVQVNYMYNDYDTSTVPITFKCRMYYQIRAGHFNPYPKRDYLDVAGTFNEDDSRDLLFDREQDSIYQVTLNLPKSLISPVTPLRFKFRINGDWNTSEFPDGGPFRTFFLQDTSGGVKNLVDVWYNDTDPTIPAAPFLTNVHIQGIYAAKQILTGAYTYEDYNLRPEGNTLYRWYLADSTTQVDLVPVGDSSINYVIDSLDAGKYIAFDVTPVASGTGDSLIGITTRVWTGRIGAVGIGDPEENKVQVYPNPATDQVIFDHLGNTAWIEIYSISGQKVGVLETLNRDRVRMDVSGLGKGIYLLKFCRTDGFSTSMFIKK